MKKHKGFTLIELLVVIAIIGILSTVILTSLSQTQGRAYDSKVKQQLNSFRTAAQLYSINHGGNFDPTTNDCGTGLFNDIDETDGSPGVYIDLANLPDHTQVTCNAAYRAYALKATLYSGTDYWCVDSTGAARQESGTPDNNTFCQ